MCTLIVGQDVFGPGTVLIAGNRDEDPARPSRGPGVLREHPPVAGGVDAVAGGTWLAVRERRAAVAMLNRWGGKDAAPPAGPLRSRGQLVLDLATAAPDGSLADGAARAARAALGSARYAPFSCVFASPAGSWLLAHRGDGDDTIAPLAPGWHALTHRELDDPAEPRAAHLVRALRDAPRDDPATARAWLMQRLAAHGPPAVCIHEGRMVTVSSFVVWLARDAAHYFHLEGRPCEGVLEDHTHRLAGAFDDGATT